MTKLTYIFPFIAGIFNVVITLTEFDQASQNIFDNAIYISFWIAFSNVFFCCLYCFLSIALAVWTGNFKKLLQEERKKADNFLILLNRNKLLYFTLCNSITGCFELLLLAMGSKLKPKVTPVLFHGSLCMGLLLFSLFIDLTGYFWVRKKNPNSTSCSAACLLCLGILLLIIHPFSLFKTLTYIYQILLLGFLSGCFLCITNALTYQLIITSHCYSEGVIFFLFSKCFFFFLISLFMKRDHFWVIHFGIDHIFNSASTVFSLCLISLGRFLILTCILYFGGRQKSYFTAVAPIIAGQLLLCAIRDIIVGFTWNSRAEIYIKSIPFSMYTFFACCFILLGSILMWFGRWDEMPKSQFSSSFYSPSSTWAPVVHVVSSSSSLYSKKLSSHSKTKEIENVSSQQPMTSQLNIAKKKTALYSFYRSCSIFSYDENYNKHNKGSQMSDCSQNSDAMQDKLSLKQKKIKSCRFLGKPPEKFFDIVSLNEKMA